MKNFNLSNCIRESVVDAKFDSILIADVKEFIRRIKGNFRDLYLNEFIDKLAGDKLINNQKETKLAGSKSYSTNSSPSDKEMEKKEWQ